MGSKAFGDSVARAAHFVRPGSGYKGEIYDLRADVEAAFLYLEGSTPLSVANLYFDSVGGNDTGNGITAGTAIKTCAELERRLAFCTPNTEYVINVINGPPDTETFRPDPRVVGVNPANTSYGVTIRIKGSLTVTRQYNGVSGPGVFAAGTQGTDPTRAAATAQAQVVDSSVASWAADQGNLIQNVNGQLAWVLTAKGGGTTARVTDWITNTAYAYTATAPVATDQYTVNTLTTWRAKVFLKGPWEPWAAGNGFQLVFELLHFDNLHLTRTFIGRNPNIHFRCCKFSNGAAGGGSAALNPPAATLEGGLIRHSGCLFHNYGSTVSSSALTSVGLSASYQQCGWLRATVFQGAGGPITAFGGCFQGGYIQAGSSSGEHNTAHFVVGSTIAGIWLGVYNDYELLAGSGIQAAILIGRYTAMTILGSVYGVGDGSTVIDGIQNRGARIFIYTGIFEQGNGSATTTTCWNLQASSTGKQIAMNGITTLAPVIDSNANGTGLWPAKTAFDTFLLYRTTFARSIINPNTAAGFFPY